MYVMYINQLLIFTKRGMDMRGNVKVVRSKKEEIDIKIFVANVEKNLLVALKIKNIAPMNVVHCQRIKKSNINVIFVAD